MTIGPAPMIRIEEMSVRLGMSLGDMSGRCRHKKKARRLRVLRAALRWRPRARPLFRPESGGREGRRRRAQQLRTGPSIARVKPAGDGMRDPHTGCAMNVMRAGLWPIFLGARRTENPQSASLAI